MNERQPVDDLFARVLRDAEAEPPQAVWGGVMAQREAHRRGRLLLRRRWGLLALLLICCGAGAYELSSSGAGEGKANPSVPAITTTASPLALAGTDVVTGDRVGVIATSGSEQKGIQAGATKSVATVSLGEASSVNNASASLPSSQKRSSNAINAHRAPNSNAVFAAGSQGTAPAARPSANGTITDHDDVSASTSIAAEDAAPDKATTLSFNAGRDVSIERLPLRTGLVGRSKGVATPVGLSDPPLHRDRTRWWVGLDIGSYAETRTWHGGDLQLAEALNGTESRHPIGGAGLSLGMVQSRGWGLSLGIMYCTARSEYRHLDHMLAPMDSLVPFVVTFNNEVVANYTETVTVLAPAQAEVAVENRYSTLRIPVEASWQHSIRRWKYRAAIGAAVECNTLRSGVTLEQGSAGSGLATVDVRSTEMKRTTVLATGSATLDFGYGLTEDWILWAGPSYATGLFPLSPAEHYPYAMPERWGLRVRLCYMLRSHE